MKNGEMKISYNLKILFPYFQEIWIMGWVTSVQFEM